MGRPERTLAAVFASPTRANLPWRDIEGLLEHVGAVRSEGNGSRVRFLLNDRAAVFHRPHPRKEAGKAVVEAVRDFLSAAGVQP